MLNRLRCAGHPVGVVVVTEQAQIELELVGQFVAARVGVLLGGIAALLDHFVEHGQCAGVIDLDALGISNAAWSLNQHGDACGWSQWQNPFRQEGFIHSQGKLTKGRKMVYQRNRKSRKLVVPFMLLSPLPATRSM